MKVRRGWNPDELNIIKDAASACWQVWSGARYCGGSYENRPFDREGMELLRAMEELKITLDISHMTAQASLRAMEHFSGAVIASHSNARTVIKGACGERHLTDETFLRLIEHDGMTGINLYNRFLKADVTASDPKTAVSLADVVAPLITSASGRRCPAVALAQTWMAALKPENSEKLYTIADLPSWHNLAGKGL